MAILGIDEVGRGPLAGPLVVGAVILPDFVTEVGTGVMEARSKVPTTGVEAEAAGADLGWILELKDSKKLSAKKREKLAEQILTGALATGLGWVTAFELDEIGMTEALKLATRRAVTEVQRSKVAFHQVVIDGKINFLAGTALEKYVSVMPKADALIKEVSAASIIAKVARDRYMTELAAEYPGYGFEKHAGYGTAAHLSAIDELGLCPEHRKSFEPCKSMCGFERPLKSVVKNTTSTGMQAEAAVAEYLVGLGHTVLMRNFKTRFCEIDVISVCEGKIYFTEVKYRASSVHGGGLEAITEAKQKQMRFAAEVFLKYYRQFSDYDPLLAAASVTGAEFTVQDWFSLL